MNGSRPPLEQLLRWAVAAARTKQVCLSLRAVLYTVLFLEILKGDYTKR
uniref:Uncharacterized protein n=1 Tax=Utricularia reniformis TaxID=192314 RepID=A0A1Y0B3D3_9LAMI|nr:hypothetical protein AEK19_MT1732 [Utricularia reniformis]ART31910.1 hypothetical protein AEK19_MT1732 [Utricularia reniformis]